MNVRIEQSWKQQLQEEFDKPYFEKLVTFVKDEYKRAHVLPLGHQIFHIFNSCPFEKVKVVILGQDPYPNPGQYYGVCFSVPEGVAIPGSTTYSKRYIKTWENQFLLPVTWIAGLPKAYSR